jgi:Fe-S-cluster containining protein
MTRSLTETLCTRCGLCCDGSLFADVELTGRAEATRLEAMGMEIEDDDTSGAQLLQPCAALRGRRCTIYEHRPECCQTFECRLLQDARRGAVGVERAKEQIAEALKRIGRVKHLLAQLGQHDEHLPLGESCAEELAKDTDADPEVNRRRAELDAAMSSVERLIRKTFLAEPRPSSARRASTGPPESPPRLIE